MAKTYIIPSVYVSTGQSALPIYTPRIRPQIALTHYSYGPMIVALATEATYWCGYRNWYNVEDEEQGYFEDGDFIETKEYIDTHWKEAIIACK